MQGDQQAYEEYNCTKERGREGAEAQQASKTEKSDADDNKPPPSNSFVC